ncbi:MAG: hypothetical protein H0X15_11170 [Acidobacteria bacterium]|nr:hypothetical protein [Pyrinomonadaceae bacterium]MBA3786073.1 hypothetical protein [Acidobacteriota bacterium]
MNFYRETIKDAPSVISIPKEFRNRDVEIIILPLDEKPENGDAVEVDKNGYPIGFFETTAGSLPDFPDREPQPMQSEREEIE